MHSYFAPPVETRNFLFTIQEHPKDRSDRYEGKQKTIKRSAQRHPARHDRMSQNRQEEKDRRRAENDYKVNLKTEIMIENLYDKVNAILTKQSALEKRLQNDGKNHTKQQENN